MTDTAFRPTVAAASATDRSEFLRRVALRTLGGLTITAAVSVLSLVYIVPLVARGGTWAILIAVYGSFLGAQILGRKMVYGGSKAAGFALGTVLQGIALSFLLAVTLVTGVADGVRLIGSCLLMVILSVLAMTVYVLAERREFSLIRAGLSMLGLPMLVLMGLQLVIPMNGGFGLVISGVFLAVSVGALLYRLNHVIHEMAVDMPTEAAFELTIAIVVFFWNLLALLNRFRRR
jgi:FtsH-binding integral membrane protein